MFRKLKDKLYYFLAEKNWGVRREYGPYVDAHQEEHAKKPWKHRWMLFRLNWHYRVLRRKTILYWPKPNNANKKAPAASGPKKHMPYLGAESESCKRSLPVHLAMQLLPYDVVSFDIFDTLLLRPFSRPADLFHVVAKRLDMPEFYRIRIDCEAEVRERSVVETGSREITIHQIYELIEQRTGLSKELGVKTEFETELQYCYANPYMKRLYNMLREQGKTIIIVSDMYLPTDMMEELLHKNGYTGYDKLYVSCDYDCNKSGKGLYKYVTRDYAGKEIAHIGDNRKADIDRAQECGIKGIHYKNVFDAGKMYRAEGMSELVGSAYMGIVNAHLHNGINKFNPRYEFGFIYGGLYVFGFCSWMYQKAKKEGIEKIIFLARDGAIYQRVFDKFFPEIDTEYFLWSRLARAKYNFEYGRYSIFEKDIRAFLNSVTSRDVGSMLDSFGLSELRSCLKQYKLSEKTILTEECMFKIEKLFTKEWKKIVEIYRPEKEMMMKYIRDKVGSAKKIAIVDVGWAGSGPVGVKQIIEKDMHLDVEVSCWLAAASSNSKVNICSMIMDDTIEAYLFDRTHNRNNFNACVGTNEGLNGIIFELFTQACAPTFAGMTRDGGFVYGLAETENNQMVRDIHQGIFDFSRIYHDTFKNDPYMYMISGYDAYMPFHLSTRDINYYTKALGDMRISRTMGDDDSKNATSTVRDYVNLTKERKRQKSR